MFVVIAMGTRSLTTVGNYTSAAFEFSLQVFFKPFVDDTDTEITHGNAFKHF